MAIIQTLGILVAIGLIIYLAVRGISGMVAAPVAAIVVIITNQMALFPSLVGTDVSYTTGLVGYIMNFFGVFLIGAILAKFMEESGAAQSIAEAILARTGTKRPYAVLVALFVITAVLTFGGISQFVVLFVLVSLAKPLFRQLKIAWNLVVIPIILGFGTFTATMLPGTPSIQNIVPMSYLGTTLTAAPVLGIIGAVVATAFGLWYLWAMLKRSLARGESFADYGVDEAQKDEARREIPPVSISVLPMIVMILLILGGSILQIPNIILIGLTVATVLAFFLLRRYIPDALAALNQGAHGSILPVFLTASTVAFGTVITQAAGFRTISDLILSIPGNPLISLSVATAAFGAITGSASGAIGIVLGAFGPTYLAMGLNPEVVHRIAAMASSPLALMPHAGIILTFLAITGLTHRNAFRYMFVTNLGSNLLALISAILGSIFIS